MAPGLARAVWHRAAGPLISVADLPKVLPNRLRYSPPLLFPTRRYQLGLVEPPPASAQVADGEWLDLRPRWPLTDRKDPRRCECEGL